MSFITFLALLQACVLSGWVGGLGFFVSPATARLA